MMPNHYDKYISDEGPENAPILFIGEAPGESEHEQGRPFIGMSGDILMSVLGRNGLSREEVRLSNLSHYRPYNNKFENLLHTDALQQGVRELYQYIKDHRPVVIVPLGSWPLSFLTGKKGIKKWRGSILPYIHDETIKVIPTFHPAAVLRDRGLYPTFDTDIRRIREDSSTRAFNLPVRKFILDPRGMELEEATRTLCEAEYLATDIETVKRSTHILCVGFSPDPYHSVCIVPKHHEGRRAIERILETPNKKIYQNGTFDTTQLRINGYQLARDPLSEKLDRDYYWDTLIGMHCLAPELPRSLEYQTSIFTREPYYKTVGRGTIPDDEKGWSMRTDPQTLYEYNAKDTGTTFEIFLKQQEEILHNPSTLSTFDFEMSMLEVAAHIGEAGLYIDKVRRELLERVLLGKWNKKQFILDRLTGYTTNVRSPKLKEILYDKDKLGLPTRRNRDGALTTDEDAIVSLIAYCKDRLNTVVKADTKLDWAVKLNVCQTILEIRGIRQVLSNYVLEKLRDGRNRISQDGRIRSTYKVGGTETGRWSAARYVDSSGFNPQTLPRDPVEVADSELTIEDGVVKLLSQLSTADSEDEEEDEEQEVA